LGFCAALRLRLHQEDLDSKAESELLLSLSDKDSLFFLYRFFLPVWVFPVTTGFAAGLSSSESLLSDEEDDFCFFASGLPCPLVRAVFTGDVTTDGFLAFVFSSSEESLLLSDDSAVVALFWRISEGLTIFFVLQAPICDKEQKLFPETENLPEMELDETPLPPAQTPLRR